MLNHVLKQNAKIWQSLMERLSTLQKLNALLSQCLPADLAAHCQVVKYEKNCLIVLVTSASWATQLRFQLPELLPKLRQHALLAQLNGIVSKVRPYDYTAQDNESFRHVKPLSAETATTVKAITSTIQDERLRKIMEKIAGN